MIPSQPFQLADAAAAGISRARLRAATADGSVREVLRGVYVDAAHCDTLELRAAAVAFAVSPHHVLVDRTAAWLHGVDVYARGELDQPPLVEVRALRDSHRSQRSGIRSGERDLGPRDITLIGGLPVTTALRTALDLGCHLKRREAYAALNELARCGGFGRQELRLQLGRFAGRRGVIQLRELTQLVDPRIESQRESWVRLAIHDAQLPEPSPQFVVHLDHSEFRLDFAYRGSRIAVEYDGEEFHTSAEDRARDNVRRDLLRKHGWRIIVVRSGDFTGEQPDQWLRTLREYLACAYTTRRAI